MALIELKNIHKHFVMGEENIHALNDINLLINEGELTSIVGTSGSGKSTLMNIIGLLDLPNSGDYFLDGHNIVSMSDDDLSQYRNQKIGFVFQSFNLLPKASALKNVEMPLQYASSYNKHLSDSLIRQKALETLEKVGLGPRVHHLPNELSGGQRQRVAIARALVNDPKILLADEPTGALDSKTSEEILTLFKDLNSQGVTVIIITHDNNIASRCKRILRMSDGFIKEEVHQ
ncbi:MAG: ABC transporter ATP-binding protein [Bacteriovorax sp.]|nr:ABC transporter ATP-binding protein [Bacteriovorax sp.]